MVKAAIMILATTITVMMAMVSITTVEAQTECVSKLVPCFNFLNSTTKPSKECCDSIKQAVDTELTCLCTIYTTGLLSRFNVTTEEALGISTRCDVKTDLSACPSGNKNSPSPKASSIPPPGHNTGKDAGAGNNLAGYGVTTVILSVISSIFF